MRAWSLAHPLLKRSVVNDQANSTTGGMTMDPINRTFIAGGVICAAAAFLMGSSCTTTGVQRAVDVRAGGAGAAVEIAQRHTLATNP